MEFEPAAYLVLFAGAFFAGLVDSMAGGGGLIQIPSLLHVLGTGSYPLVFGTNKLSSIVGTVGAAVRYAKGLKLPLNAILPASLGALVFAYLGSLAVTYISAELLTLLVPLLLSGVAIYTYRNKRLGFSHQPKLSGVKERFYAFAMGAVVGFYDGFFGPGTGSFLMLGFVTLFGFDFLVATASAKIVNVVCNAASLALFYPAGFVLVGLGLGMSVFNLLGSTVGSSLALAHGAPLVRRVLLVVVSALIIKTGFSAYAPLLGALMSR
jgi:uncharacterized membrane protein YfcA